MKDKTKRASYHREWRHKEKMIKYKKEHGNEPRRCAAGCGTILNSYNPHKYCSLHRINDYI